MIATDGVLLGMLAAFVGYLVFTGKGRFKRHRDTVVMRSIPGLYIAGSIFGIIAGGAVMGGLWFIVDRPMALTPTKIGPVHSWAMGIVGLGIGGIIGFPAILLFAKAKELRLQPKAPAVEQAAPARMADLEGARRTARGRITASATIDQLAATARDFLRDAYLTPPAEVQARWQPLLDRFDAARFGGAPADPSALGSELRALIG